jgi:hypothetical protein
MDVHITQNPANMFSISKSYVRTSPINGIHSFLTHVRIIRTYNKKECIPLTFLAPIPNNPNCVGGSQVVSFGFNRRNQISCLEKLSF